MNANELTIAAPAGIAPEVWAAALAAAKAQLPAAKTSTRKVADGLVELTLETAQKLYDDGKAEATVKAGDLGLLVILPTIETTDKGGCYSMAVVKDAKVVNVMEAHVDRVRSNRCLPRAIRLMGTYLGEHGGKQFANGPAKKDEKPTETPAETPASTPEPTPEPTPAKGKGKNASGKNAGKKSRK